MGENGAGKSTLMKILAGAYTATSGEILIDGKPQTIRGPKDALAAGITLIYQEMQLAPNLTVAENIFLGSELARGGLVQRKAMLSQAQAVIDRLGAQFKASDRVMTLTIAEQQQVEIARALHRQSRILVMDEPTAALSSRETQRLFELVLRLRDEEWRLSISATAWRKCMSSPTASASCATGSMSAAWCATSSTRRSWCA